MTARIDAFDSVPISNLLHHDAATFSTFRSWMIANDRSGTCPEWSKRVLGRQDYCWTGGSGNWRFWIWERPFEVDFGKGRTETWHWRLFASKRGFQLEIEDAYKRPFGQSLRTAGLAGLDAFLAIWRDGCIATRAEGDS